MKLITLLYPNGESLAEPHEAEIQSLLFHPEQHFLASGCGEAAIEVRKGVSTSLLAIRFGPGVGFSFEHMTGDANGENFGQSYISCHSTDDAVPVVVSVGGMLFILPSTSFYDATISQIIVNYFMDTMEKSPLVAWDLATNIPLPLYGQ